MEKNKEYHCVNSLALGGEWQYASSEDAIVFGFDDGSAEIFQGGTRESLTLTDSLSAIELDRYLFCLSGDRVSAHTTTEVELWSQSVPKATDIVSFRQRDVLGVITDNGRVVGLDAETGSQIFKITRPHDDFSDINVAGENGVLCIGCWSFVVCIDASGDVLVDKNFDSTIEDISIVGELIVVSLKDDTVEAIHSKTGKHQWSMSASVKHMSQIGSELVAGLTESGVVLIYSEGRIEELPIEGGNKVISTADSSELAVISGNEAIVYQLGPPPAQQLSIDVLTTTLDEVSPIRVYIENTGSDQINTSIRLITSENSYFESTHSEVNLLPGESSELAFRLHDLPPTTPLECEFTIDNTVIKQSSIDISKKVDLRDTLSIETLCEEVRNDTILFSHNVTNTTDFTLDTITVADMTEREVEAGETVSVEREYPLDGNQRSISVEAMHCNTEETFTDTFTVPNSAIQTKIIRQENNPPSIKIPIKPTRIAPVLGEMTIYINNTWTVSYDVHIGKNVQESVTIILPPSLACKDQLDVQIDSPLLSEKHQKKIRGWTREEVPDILETNTERVLDSGQNTSQVNSFSSAAEASPADTEQQHINNQAGSLDENATVIERRAPSSVKVAEKFTEKIRITNQAAQPVRGIKIESDGASRQIQKIDPGESLILTRDHAFFEAGNHRLPPVQVGTATTEPHQLRVSRTDLGIGVLGAVQTEAKELTVTFRLQNNREKRCRISRVGVAIDKKREWSKTVSVGPGETEFLKETVDISGSIQPDIMPFDALVEYGYDGDRTARVTLGAMEERSAVSPTDRYSISVLGKSRIIARTQSVLELGVMNETTAPVEDATISVTGDSVLQTALSQDTKVVQRIDPGEERTMLVDVEPQTAGTETFELEIESRVDGNMTTQQYTLSGPVAESDAEWDGNNTLEQWETTKRSEHSTNNIQIDETHLVTAFQPTEAGNHR